MGWIYEISNIENGKRTVGKKIAEKLANALNFDYRLLLEDQPALKKRDREVLQRKYKGRDMHDMLVVTHKC